MHLGVLTLQTQLTTLIPQSLNLESSNHRTFLQSSFEIIQTVFDGLRPERVLAAMRRAELLLVFCVIITYFLHIKEMCQGAAEVVGERSA